MEDAIRTDRLKKDLPLPDPGSDELPSLLRAALQLRGRRACTLGLDCAARRRGLLTSMHKRAISQFTALASLWRIWLSDCCGGD
jgi:hypothetical protein